MSIELAQRLAGELPAMDAAGRVALIAELFGSRARFSTSLGMEDQVLLHLIAASSVPATVFAIDTGRLFEESLQLLEENRQRYPNIRVEVFFPDAQALQKLMSAKGPFSFYQSKENRVECCTVRKVEPLGRALKGAACWITGIRQEQGSSRSDLPMAEWDATHEVVKIHPLLDWSWDQVIAFAKDHNVPVCSLHTKGFPSIGCAPCTRAVSPGQPWRAGRWWWENGSSQECGLHVHAKTATSAPAPAPAALPTARQVARRTPGHSYSLDWARQLEAESIQIIREGAAQFEKIALLFSAGKDSIVLAHLAKKAFYPALLPFPLLHIDTEHNFPETIVFRDQFAQKHGHRLLVRSVQTSIDEGRVKEEKGKYASRNMLQTRTLLDAIDELKLQALFGGARRDEEKARAKERIFSIRDEFGQWEPKLQRPELWNNFNGHIHKGENVRIFPLSNWTELDIWRYIQREGLELPSVYFAHERPCFVRDGMLYPASDFIYRDADETLVRKWVRMRTVGDMSCTAAVESRADTLEEVVREIEAADTTERGSRIDDKRSEAAMEDRKRGGYF